MFLSIFSVDKVSREQISKRIKDRQLKFKGMTMMERDQRFDALFATERERLHQCAAERQTEWEI
jgi:hypothetical protein